MTVTIVVSKIQQRMLKLVGRTLRGIFYYSSYYEVPRVVKFRDRKWDGDYWELGNWCLMGTEFWLRKIKFWRWMMVMFAK